MLVLHKNVKTCCQAKYPVCGWLLLFCLQLAESEAQVLLDILMLLSLAYSFDKFYGLVL